MPGLKGTQTTDTQWHFTWGVFEDLDDPSCFLYYSRRLDSKFDRQCSINIQYYRFSYCKAADKQTGRPTHQPTVPANQAKQATNTRRSLRARPKTVARLYFTALYCTALYYKQYWYYTA